MAFKINSSNYINCFRFDSIIKANTTESTNFNSIMDTNPINTKHLLEIIIRITNFKCFD